MNKNNKKEKISLSIGIPAHNEEANIKNLLLAILSQREVGFFIEEIIVISDGSTDRTVDKIREVKNGRIKLIVGKSRKGQTARQNEILDMLDQKTDCFLLLESDTLPKDKNFIKNLVSSIPPNKEFSVIVGKSIPIEPTTTFFEKIINFGFYFKMDIFEHAIRNSPLYLYGGQDGRLFSKTFLTNFRWNSDYHEDSYSFRKAINSGLPILKNKKAKIYFKSVDNLHDHLLQSGKFLKAKEIEKNYSNLYELKLDYFKFMSIILKYFIKNPILFTTYVLAVLSSRIYSHFLPRYTEFWDTYKSTKKLNSGIEQ